MEKEKIDAVCIEINQINNSIKTEKNIVDTIKTLLERSQSRIVLLQQKAEKTEDELYAAMFEELYTIPEYKTLMQMKSLETEGFPEITYEDTYEEQIKKTFKNGVGPTGISITVPKSELKQKINFRKFKILFQKLIDKYYNELYFQEVYKTVIHVDNFKKQYVIKIFMDIEI